MPAGHSQDDPTRHLAVHLQCLGLRMAASPESRKGGAGPAEGITIMLDGRPLTVPTRGAFIERSPYSLHLHKGGHLICKDGLPLAPVTIPGTPRYYALTTGQGIPYSSIALLHGNRCLGSTVFQTCVHWHLSQRCAFCGIELSLQDRATVHTKSPDQLLEVALAAARLDAIEHITLTTGSRADEREEITHLAACCNAIKAHTPLPVHVQIMPPQDAGLLALLAESGADTLGIHIESFDPAVLEKAAPCKAAIGRSRFIRSWKEAVKLVGRNQVSSFLIAGLGESPSSIIEGTAHLCDLGVYPFIVPLRPIPGTALETQAPPAPEVMIELYRRTADHLRSAGLSWKKSKAGCVRCGACSGLPDFEA